ncbi:TetR family transcriptional regulator [Streptomyces sp. NPDC005892]|uniref:TetR family transcriptional regulator n=1 Tax=Streptomyces sp. NPDC005892 TaxID=3155593 RepID=UPI0033D8224F
MVKQERGVRTRSLLVETAATEFDRAGYEGTSMSRLSHAASVSTGALTFHFATKSELAAAVEESGCSAVREAVEEAMAPGGPALDTLAAVVLALASLAEREPAVRAAARLAQERREGGRGWLCHWLPQVEALLQRAASQRQLAPDVAPRTVVLLVLHLVCGTVARAREAGDDSSGEAVRELAEQWRLVRRGIVAPAAARR